MILGGQEKVSHVWEMVFDNQEMILGGQEVVLGVWEMVLDEQEVVLIDQDVVLGTRRKFRAAKRGPCCLRCSPTW